MGKLVDLFNDLLGLVWWCDDGDGDGMVMCEGEGMIG